MVGSVLSLGFVVLWAVVLVVGLVLMLKGPLKLLGRILFFTALVVFIGVISLVLLVMAAFSGLAAKFYMPLVIVSMLYLMLLVILAACKVLRGKRLVALLLVGVLGVGIGEGVYKIKEHRRENVLTIGESNLLFNYIPFSEGNKLATLDAPASLRLEGNLPMIDGATALYPVYAAFAQEVYPEELYDEDTVRCTTTSLAYESLINGEVDMIFALRPSKEQEEAAIKAGRPLKLTPIGKEAFVFYVNHKNPIDGLTVEEIQGIYSGEITNWSEVGGRRSDIRAFQRDAGSGSQTALEHLMGDKPIMPPRTEDYYEGMMGIVQATADYQNYPDALGYSFRFYVTGMVEAEELKLLEIDGIAPTYENIKNESYPLTSELYMITAGTENPNVKPFMDWILSPEGQTLIERTGYVPVGETME